MPPGGVTHTPVAALDSPSLRPYSPNTAVCPPRTTDPPSARASEPAMKLTSTCSGPLPLSRRQVLQVGGISLLNLSLPQLLRAHADGGKTPKADACILIFLNGGPSHLDMWD